MTSKPKISVNKLGEYITASPTRRKSIVQNQKNPVNFITTRYADARAAYVRFLTQGFDQQHIHDAIALLKKKPTSTDFQQNDKESSIEALERFTEVDFPNLSAFEIVAYAGNTKLDIAGVDISVNPDLIFRGKHKGKSALGAI